MKITKQRLLKIIKEEVSRALLETDVINADSGEILTLPQELEGTHSDNDEISDAEFEMLRSKIKSLFPQREISFDSSSWEDDDDDYQTVQLDADSVRMDNAVAELRVAARDAMNDFLADMNVDIGNAEGYAHDLAAGLKYNVSNDTWLAAVQRYDGDENALINALAEIMVG